MDILNSGGLNILEEWTLNKSLIRAELISGNVSLSFTGRVRRYSSIEIVLYREPDEMSVSLFCGNYHIVEPEQNKIDHGAWKYYRRIVQIHTDGGAQCTLHELRGKENLEVVSWS